LKGLAPRCGGAIVLRADHDLLLSVTSIDDGPGLMYKENTLV
jgi:hypothetical protein